MNRNRSIAASLVILNLSLVCYPTTRIQQDRASKKNLAVESTFSLEQVLWWLPEDTETVSVVRGPFKVAAPLESSEGISPADYVGPALRQMALGGLGSIKEGAFLKQFIGCTVSLCVEGSRRFRPPTGFGGMRFEGCSITILKQDFTERTTLLNQMARQAKRFHNLEGHRVVEFEEKLEEDIWKFFVAMPAPTVLLSATDQAFLTEVMSRMHKKALNRALPEALFEWKHVNTSAKFWSLRHYDKTQAQDDPTSPLSGSQEAANWPDTEAVGIVFDYDPARSKVAAVRYLSRNQKGLKSFSDTIKKASYPGQDFKPHFNETNPGIIEMTVSLDLDHATSNASENEQAGIFLIVLLMLFGHGVYL